MEDPLDNKLRETGWRRKLSAQEEAALRAWLAAHPEHQPDWEMEAELTDALARLPDAPLPSNFTARVMQAVERETTTGHSRARWQWIGTWRALLPKAAVAVVALGLGVFAYERHAATQRTELARRLARVSSVAAVPDPELLQDLEFIRHLDQTLAPDEELLALLQ